MRLGTMGFLIIAYLRAVASDGAVTKAGHRFDRRVVNL